MKEHKKITKDLSIYTHNKKFCVVLTGADDIRCVYGKWLSTSSLWFSGWYSICLDEKDPHTHPIYFKTESAATAFILAREL